LKASGLVFGIGLEFSDFAGVTGSAVTDFDWITLRGGCTILRHPPEVLAFMAKLAPRQIPVIASGVFERGFLVGGNRLDGCALNPQDAADRSRLAWRKSFVALCDGHGISPAQASVQFVLSAPSVVAVTLESSYVDRVAENVSAVSRKAPPNFWQSMKEEGLLDENYPIGDV
jgi:D-threo-aldose 1-dehydrogenase